MPGTITIGPIEGIKDLVEVLPLLRNLSGLRPEVVIAPQAEYLGELLRHTPQIQGLRFSDSGPPRINIRDRDPLTEAMNEDRPYVYPWLYIDPEQRATSHKDLPFLEGPVVTVLKDGFSHEAFLSVKRFLRDEFAIEPEVVTFREKGRLKEGLSRVVASDLVISSSVDEALLVPATGTPLLVITEDEQRTRLQFRAFLPGPTVSVRDEFGPVIKVCPPERDTFGRVLEEVLPVQRAIFFDRDGTLCEDVHYLRRIEDLRLFREVERLNTLKDKGYLLIGITNQSGIARGIVPPEVNQKVNEVFITEYGFDGFYYCPHHPDEHCACRKPSPGMLFKARRDHRINLRASVVVGDKDADTLVAKAVGAKAVLVRTGQQGSSPYADEVIEDLTQLHTIV